MYKWKRKFVPKKNQMRKLFKTNAARSLPPSPPLKKEHLKRLINYLLSLFVSLHFQQTSKLGTLLFVYFIDRANREFR